MEEALIQRLEQSFNMLAPRGPELMDRFYAHLFSKHPAVRKMFPRDMSGQKNKLLAALVLVVQNLRKPETLQPVLIEMGGRHVGYGTEPEHYPIVRDTLVQVMADMAGEKWSAQLTADWTAALSVVAGIMMEGHKIAKESCKPAAD